MLKPKIIKGILRCAAPFNKTGNFIYKYFAAIFVPSGLKIYLGYICSLTYCSIMLVSAFSRWGCLAGGHPHREPP